MRFARTASSTETRWPSQAYPEPREGHGLRLLYVIDALTPGGAETSLVEMTPGLIAGGIDLHVLPLGPGLDLAPALSAAGATVHRRSRSSGRVGNVRAVLSVARRIRPDLIHTTLFEADVAGRAGARVLGIPSSSSLVNDSYSPAHYNEAATAKLHAARALDAVTARSAARFHAISEAIALSVPPRIGASAAVVDVIPRGRDPHKYEFRPAALRTKTRDELGLSPQSPAILAIGRLDPQKGFDHLIQALPEVATKHPGIVTMIAGKDGRSSVELRKAAQAAEAEVRDALIISGGRGVPLAGLAGVREDVVWTSISPVSRISSTATGGGCRAGRSSWKR